MTWPLKLFSINKNGHDSTIFLGGKILQDKIYGHPFSSTQIVTCAQLNGHNDSVVPRVVNAPKK